MMIARVAALLALAVLIAGAVPSRAADIGGPFALIDHHGNDVTEST
jgi:hypothetical protein